MNSAFRGVPRLGKNLFQSRQLLCKSGFNWNRSLFVGQCLSMEHLEKNAFYEKYAHKLKTLQKYVKYNFYMNYYLFAFIHIIWFWLNIITYAACNLF